MLIPMVRTKGWAMSQTSSRFIGVDPGNQGAIVMIEGGSSWGSPSFIRTMPLTKVKVGKKFRETIDGYLLADLCKEVEALGPDHIMVEHLWSRPTDRPMSSWGLSGSYHRCIQAIESCGMAYHLVSPLAWKNKVLADNVDWTGNKEASIEYIEKAYPDWPLSVGRQRTPKDGIADAYCLALYGRMKYGKM